MSEIDEKVADYQRKMKESRMQAVRRMDGNSLQHVFARCLYLRKPFDRGDRAIAARQDRQGIAGHGGAAARQGISAYQVTST